MARMWFAISMALRHIDALARILRASNRRLFLWEIALEEVLRDKPQVLAVDFDGVLAPHGDDAPTSEMAAWLKLCVTEVGATRIFILTNRPGSERVAYFNQHFPGVRLLSGVRKKPYPDGLLKISEIAAVPIDQILLFDDRLLTGAVAALLAGARVHYVARPLMRLSNRPVKELFFQLLRVSERWGVRILSRGMG